MKKQTIPEEIHSDFIVEPKPNKISHTRHWIELSIVVVVIAVLAIIVIPIITTISKSADYSKAFERSSTIITAFEIANKDAETEKLEIPNTNVIFTSNHLDDDISSINEIEKNYRILIADKLRLYLASVTDNDFTFKLIKTPTTVALYYWDKKDKPTLETEPGYVNPDYVCVAQEPKPILLTYDEFLERNLLPNN